jgi:hypothetical protein
VGKFLGLLSKFRRSRHKVKERIIFRNFVSAEEFLRGKGAPRKRHFFLFEIVNGTGNCLELYLKEKRKMTFSLERTQVVELAKLLTKEVDCFIKDCLECPNRCPYDLGGDASLLFEARFQENRKLKRIIPKKFWKKALKEHFFLVEINAAICERIKDYLEKGLKLERVSDRDIDYLGNRVAEMVLDLVKNCQACAEGCLYYPYQNARQLFKEIACQQGCEE